MYSDQNQHSPEANVTIAPTQEYGAGPQGMTCPYCRAQVTTRTESRSTTDTHIVSLLVWFLCDIRICGLLTCCCCCREIKHYCPKCNRYLGSNDD